jgi:glycosyltransferase involved in cell wall biosynthesis
MTSYFFDLTATAQHLKRSDQFSGIQRTVVMLIEKVSAHVGAEYVHLGVFNDTTGVYETFPMTALAPGELTNVEAFRARLGYVKGGDILPPLLHKYRDQPWKLKFHRAKYDLASFFGYDRAFARTGLTGEEWKSQNRRTLTRSSSLTFSPIEAVAHPGDQLILLDATFTASRSADAFRAARTLGLSTCTLIYDLIPIVKPEFVSDLASLTFYEWLCGTESYTDRYLTDSQSAHNDLQGFLQVHGIKRPIRVVSLAQAPLPAHIEGPLGSLAGKIDRNTYPKVLDSMGIPDRTRALTAYPFVLCVGTLETRKNNWRLAMVWDRLQRAEGLRVPKLIFAGRPGWKNDDFNRLMLGTQQLGGWVEIIEGPSDRELEYLYKNCEFVAMPSLYEGWGLPVGEALSYGKTAVVSSVSSLPEVGLDLVEYCDPTSIDSIAEACLRLIANTDRRLALEEKIRKAALRSWDDVARDLVSAISRE